MFLVLEIVARGPVTALKAANLSGLNRTTVHRLLKDLELSRYINRDLLGRYVIGPRLHEMAEGRTTDPLQHESDQVLTTLQSYTGADAMLFWADGDDRVCIGACLGAPTPLQIGMKVGTRLAPSVCASALTLLAWSASRRLAARHLEVAGQQFGQIRQQGWASSVTDDGVGAISAPIRDQLGEVVAAIAIFGGTTMASPPSTTHYAPKVVEAGWQLTEAMRRAPV